MRDKLILLFIAGLVLRWSPALDTIHELMHYGWCSVEGIEVINLAWSKITYARQSAYVLYGGYYTELILYSLIVMCCSYKRRLAGAFFLGILSVVYLKAFGSYDFNKYALALYGDRAIVTGGLIRWGIVSSIVMLMTIGMFYKRREG